MSSIVILYQNYSDTALLTGGSWTLPLTNLQTADVQQVARSNGATNAATIILADLGASKAIDGIMLGPANFTPGATWRARGYSDATYVTLVYDSTVQTVTGSIINWASTAAWLEWEDVNFWLGLSSDLDDLPQYVFHIPTASQSAQYWKIEIFDSSNSDGFVEVGRLMISKAFRPSINYGETNSLSIVPLTDMQESLGGLRTYWERGQRRVFSCSFPWLTESELFDGAFNMMLRSGTSKQLFVVPDPADTTYGARRSFLATLKQVPAIQQLLVSRGSTAIDLEEVL